MKTKKKLPLKDKIKRTRGVKPVSEKETNNIREPSPPVVDQLLFGTPGNIKNPHDCNS